MTFLPDHVTLKRSDTCKRRWWTTKWAVLSLVIISIVSICCDLKLNRFLPMCRKLGRKGDQSHFPTSLTWCWCHRGLGTGHNRLIGKHKVHPWTVGGSTPHLTQLRVRLITNTYSQKFVCIFLRTGHKYAENFHLKINITVISTLLCSRLCNFITVESEIVRMA